MSCRKRSSCSISNYIAALIDTCSSATFCPAQLLASATTSSSSSSSCVPEKRKKTQTICSEEEVVEEEREDDCERDHQFEEESDVCEKFEKQERGVDIEEGETTCDEKQLTLETVSSHHPSSLCLREPFEHLAVAEQKHCQQRSTCFPHPASPSSSSSLSYDHSILNTHDMHLLQLPRDFRLIPMILCECVNSADVQRLKCLVDSYFTKTCFVKTPSGCSFNDRTKIIDVFSSLMMSVPDIVLRHAAPVVCRRMIVTKMTTSGTIVRNDKNDCLWNYMKHSPDAHNHYPINDGPYLEPGCEVTFEERGELLLVLNEEQSRIDTIVHIKKWNDFSFKRPI